MRDFKRKDIFISISIVLVTLLYFVDRYLIPEDMKTVSVFGFEIGSFGFMDINELVYFSKMKLLILFFSITWYLTCGHWWKPAILVIIILELFKLVSLFNTNSYYIDEIEYLISLPITTPIIILLILLSSKLNRLNLSYEVRNSLDGEIDEVFFQLNKEKSNELNELKEKIKNIKKKYHNESKESYVNELISIRDEFYKL